ncbi:MAG: DMT family transporter [Candidatus Woesearchaeota archaeon]
MRDTKYPLYVLIAMLIFGSMGIFARLSGQNGLVIVAAASLVSALSMLFVLLKRKQLKPIFTGKIWMLILIGILGAANNSLYFYAFTLTKISDAAFLHYLAPAFVLVLSLLFLGEKITSKKVIAVAVAMFGLVLITGKPSFASISSVGNILAIGSALAYGASIIAYKRVMKHFNVMQIIFGQMAFSFLVFSPFLFSAIPFIQPISWIYLLIIGFVHQFIAVIFHLKGLEGLKATTVAILGYLEPFFALILAWLFLGEAGTMLSIVGGALILASGYIIIKKN